MALYAQDSIRLNSRLTVNLGLRWDPSLPPYDYFNTGNTFSQAAFNAGQRSTVFPNAPAGLLFYGDPGIPRGFQHSNLALFSPRLGIVWDPTGSGRQTIRVSGAILRDTEDMFYNSKTVGNAPYGTTTNRPLVSQLEPSPIPGAVIREALRSRCPRPYHRTSSSPPGVPTLSSPRT